MERVKAWDKIKQSKTRHECVEIKSVRDDIGLSKAVTPKRKLLTQCVWWPWVTATTAG